MLIDRKAAVRTFCLSVLVLAPFSLLLVTTKPSLHEFTPSIISLERKTRRTSLTTSYCDNSLKDTRGLICVRDSLWSSILEEDDLRWKSLRKWVAQDGLRLHLLASEARNLADYRQVVWAPTLTCPSQYRVGEIADGGKWICNLPGIDDPKWNPPNDKCLVYSFGVGGKFGFEEQLLRRNKHGCEVHMYDPDASRWRAPNLNSLHIHDFGLATEKTERSNFKSYRSFLKMNGHTKRTVNVLKMDAEGIERTVLPEIASLPLHQRPQQILVEVHFQTTNKGHERMIKDFDRALLALRKAGYVIFHMEQNYYCSTCTEFSFLQLASRTLTGSRR